MLQRAIWGAYLICSSFFCSSFFAQEMFGQATFEVASVKPAPPPTGPGLRVMMNQDQGRINYSNVSLMNILTRAYKVKEQQIIAPDWVRSARYDITAKLPEGASKEQIPEMLQALLAERFKLTMHKEQKVAPVYALVIAKSGLKAKAVESEGGRVGISMGPKGRKLNGRMSMTTLADSLSNFMDRVVVDATGAAGVYDINLEWTPEAGEGLRGFGGLGPQQKAAPPNGPGEPAGKTANDGPDAPSIFTAIQEQLGLRLEPKKGPMEMVVIDSLEKVPTEN